MRRMEGKESVLHERIFRGWSRVLVIGVLWHKECFFLEHTFMAGHFGPCTFPRESSLEFLGSQASSMKDHVLLMRTTCPGARGERPMWELGSESIWCATALLRLPHGTVSSATEKAGEAKGWRYSCHFESSAHPLNEAASCRHASLQVEPISTLEPLLHYFSKNDRRWMARQSIFGHSR